MSLITCSRCGGRVYEYGPPTRGLERVVSRLTGCTTFSCYGCGRRGWLRKGRSSSGIAMLARSMQGLIILSVVFVMAIIFFGAFMR